MTDFTWEKIRLKSNVDTEVWWVLNGPETSLCVSPETLAEISRGTGQLCFPCDILSERSARAVFGIIARLCIYRVERRCTRADVAGCWCDSACGVR